MFIFSVFILLGGIVSACIYNFDFTQKKFYNCSFWKFLLISVFYVVTIAVMIIICEYIKSARLFPKHFTRLFLLKAICVEFIICGFLIVVSRLCIGRAAKLKDVIRKEVILSILSPCQVKTFLSTLIFGIACHGMVLFNKFSYHDDVGNLFSYGAGITSGRWALDVSAKIYKYFLGDLASLPLFNGMICIFLIAITACILVQHLEIKRTECCIAIGGGLVAFPFLTSLFGYMFTSVFYCIGVFFGVYGTTLICKFKLRFLFLGCSLIGFAVGIYQAMIPLVLCVFVLSMIKNLSDSKDYFDSLKKIIYIIASCILFMFFYLFILRLALYLFNTKLSNYKGISDTLGGNILISEYFRRALFAYKEFFYPTDKRFLGMFPEKLCGMYRLIVSVNIILGINKIWKSAKNSIGVALLQCLVFISFPFAVNFIYVMTKNGWSSLTFYSLIMPFVMCVYLIDDLNIKFTGYRFVSSFLFFIIIILYCKFDNLCYLEAELSQSEAISYGTILISRIQSTDGYEINMPVLFLHYNKNNDPNVTKYKQFGEINIRPYERGLSQYITDYEFVRFLRQWCGYSPVITKSDSFEKKEEIKNMPCYPNSGSIKIIDGIVVIKFQ